MGGEATAWGLDAVQALRLDALAPIPIVFADCLLARAAGLDAHPVTKELIVGAPRAHGAGGGVVAGQTVVLANRAIALAVPAVRSNPVIAGERGSTFPAERARGVLDQAVGTVEPDAGVVAPVAVKELAGVAAGAVFTVLLGAVLADLAVGNG